MQWREPMTHLVLEGAVAALLWHVAVLRDPSMRELKRGLAWLGVRAESSGGSLDMSLLTQAPGDASCRGSRRHKRRRRRSPGLHGSLDSRCVRAVPILCINKAHARLLKRLGTRVVMARCAAHNVGCACEQFCTSSPVVLTCSAARLHLDRVNSKHR